MESSNTTPKTASDYAKRVSELLLCSIDILKLSVRSKNSLAARKVKNIADLVEKTDRQLLSYRGLGRKSLDEIEQKLHKQGLSLAVSSPRQTKKQGNSKSHEMSLLDRVAMIERQVTYFKNLGFSVELTPQGKVNLRKA